MSDADRHTITEILKALSTAGNEKAEVTQRLFEAVYSELRAVAGDMMRRERSDHTLQPTALVNEAYIRLVESSAVQWENRAHFFGTAARAMRQILVDHARGHQAAKRGGGWERVTLDENVALLNAPDVAILDLDRILTKLSEMDPRMEQIVELRVFGGLTVQEVAHVLEVSERTIYNDWRVAKMWLARELAQDREG